MKKIQFILSIQTVISLLIAPSQAKTNLMALMPVNKQFQIVLDGIRTELDTSYSIDIIDMSKPATIEAVAKKCRKDTIKALILMDIKAVHAVQDLQKTDSAFASMPKFVYMTLMAETTSRELSNVAGIKFEVPIYTLVTNFRIISQKDFSKTAIFYRKSFAGSIEKAKRLLDKEQISLQAVCIDCGKNGKTTEQDALTVMEKSFDGMIKKRDSEVLLVLADNLIVNNTSMAGFWMRTVKKKKVPVIATFDILASPQIALAVFTADPDLSQLGAQAANQIVEFFENETPLEEIGFEPTISIKSTFNQAVAQEIGWKIKKDKLGRINKIIK